MNNLKQNKILVLFFTVAFLLNASLSYFVQQDFNSEKSLFGDKFLICTVEGFKVVDVNDLDIDGNKPSPSHSNYKCPACVAFNDTNHNISTIATLSNARKYLFLRQFKNINDDNYYVSLHNFSLSRAPPSLV